MDVLVHYGELALKGKNRHVFEKQLVTNIEQLADAKVKRLYGRFEVRTENPQALDNIFGIAWYAPYRGVQNSYESIRSEVFSYLTEKKIRGKTFALHIKRSNKSFQPGSMALARALGQEIVDEFGLAVDLDHPDIPIHIEIADQTYIFFKKKEGKGGLPVGVSGHVLILFSGGVDSLLAAYQMMKRGCRVDYVHFHTYSDNKRIEKTKIVTLARALSAYQTNARLYLVPYYPFQVAVSALDSGYELMIFRRFMGRVAQAIARKSDHKALVTGDNLGQVASQTLENIAAFDHALALPVLRPLLTFNKHDIIQDVRDLDLYKTTLEEYKDCCSIIASKPKTKANTATLQRLEERIGVAKIIDETLPLIGSLSV